jgi:hypothetical protein
VAILIRRGESGQLTPNGGARVKAIVLVAVLSAACARGDREVRLQRLEVQRRGLVAQLDGLQARLLVDRERVGFWEELRERRQTVVATTCGAEEQSEPALAVRLDPPAVLGRPRGPRPARLAAALPPGGAPDPTP